MEGSSVVDGVLVEEVVEDQEVGMIPPLRIQASHTGLDSRDFSRVSGLAHSEGLLLDTWPAVEVEGSSSNTRNSLADPGLEVVATMVEGGVVGDRVEARVQVVVVVDMRAPGLGLLPDDSIVS